MDAFIIATDGTRVFNDCISLANSGSVGKAFYEPFDFVASDHVTHLKMACLNKWSYLFLVSVIEKQKSNYNFNREINDARIKAMKIMLPTTSDGQPDYALMEQVGKRLMFQKYDQYLRYLENGTE